tara:strand:- start:59 stop:571 length:513 start_codon:yes stop_codon:yes gene_type:complete
MALKKSSSTIVISSSVTESAANTFTSEQVDLQLNPLDNEVFVVVGVNLDPGFPDSVAGTSTAVNATVSTTARTTIGSIAESNVIASARNQIVTNAAMTPDGGIPFSREDPLVMPLDMEYLAIIATNDFFLNIEGIGNGNAKTCVARLYGYRAKADASTYAALVQSELLSA